MKRVLLVVAVLVLWAAPAGAKPPKACTQALTRGEQIITLHIQFAEAVSDYLGDQDAVLFTAEVKQITRAAGPVIDEFRALSRRCRKDLETRRTPRPEGRGVQP